MKYLTLLSGLAILLVLTSCTTRTSVMLELDEIVDEGQESYRISTPSATWIFHKEGAGFSSILDVDGNDWLNYHPEGGPAGHYRGLPNAVYNYDSRKDNFFHAGHTGKRASRSEIVRHEDGRIVIRSESTNGRWMGEWEILSDRAIFTMIRIPEDEADKYWVLYEGTPGGQFTYEDLCLRSDGSLTTLEEQWEDSMQDIEWVAFISKSTGRSLLLMPEKAIDQPLSYRPMENSMTVFGFGRALGPPVCQLKESMSFMVSILDESDPDRIMKRAKALQRKQ